MNTLGASQLERTICATAGHHRHGDGATAFRPRSIPRSGRTRATCSSGAGTRCPPLRTSGASCSTRARRARSIVVVDPFRSRTARVADEHLRPLPGTDAALGDRHDARDRRRRPRTTRSGAAPTPTATTSCSRAVGAHPIEHCAAICGVDAETIARVGREFASTRPALLRLGVGRPAPPRRAGRLLDARLAARAHRRLARPWRRLLLHPHRHGGGGERGAASARGPAARAGAHDQHVPARRGAHRSRARPAGEGARVLELEPGRDRARPGARARRPAPRRPLHGGARAVHDRHRRAAPTWCCRPPRSSSTSTCCSPGAITTSPGTSRRSRRVGEAKPNTETFRLLAARLGPGRSLLRGDRRASSLDAAARAASPRTACASAAGPRSTSAQGPTPHADGGFVHRDRQAARYAPTTCRPPRWPTPQLAERFPLAMITPKTHLFLNSTFANQQPPALRPARARRWCVHPADAEPRGHRRRRDGARVQRPRPVRLRGARVRRRPPGRARGADGLVERATTPAAAARQATTSQRADGGSAARRPSTTTASRWRPSGGSRPRAPADVWPARLGPSPTAPLIRALGSGSAPRPSR